METRVAGLERLKKARCWDVFVGVKKSGEKDEENQ